MRRLVFAMGYDEIVEAHDEACRSDARAGLQVMHSPGGYLSGLNEAAKEIEAMWRKAGKPLHSIAADMSYSAAEWLAFCGSKRWITQAGGAGSVGVIVTRPVFTEANKLAGMRFEQIASGEYKTDGDLAHVEEPLHLSIMGCAVNGPGEAHDSQLGITFGRQVGMICKNGVPMRKVAGVDIVEEFVKEVELLRTEGSNVRAISPKVIEGIVGE